MKKAKAEISMSQTGIGSILKLYTLKVPSHQREYSWTRILVQKLFNDLQKAISGSPEYFLGTVATFRDGSGQLVVIDGQQRLATVTILLSQIRNYLKTRDEFLVENLKAYLEYSDRSQRAVIPRLKLNLSDSAFFAEMLMAKSDADWPEPALLSQRLILGAFEEAAKYVKKIVASFDPKDHADVLDTWITYIEESAEVILLQMPMGYNAYKMFETLNDRGLETTQADLVKNYIFEQAESDERLPEAEASWHRIRALLDALQEDRDITVIFMRCALILIQGPLTKDQIFDVVQAKAKGALNALNLCRQMEGLAATYAATFSTDHEKWVAYPDAIKLAIKTLNFFNIQPFRPVIVAVADKFEPKEAVKALDLLISVAVRVTIASSTSSGSIESVLHPTAADIFNGEITTPNQFRKRIESIIPNDLKFRNAFAVATVTKTALARYYLRTLERVVKQEPTPWFNINDDREVIDLEHILPENPGDNYPNFSLEDAAAYVRRLGNMALHAKKLNSENRSDAFTLKKGTYADCPYMLTHQLSTVPDWTADLIVERQAKMAEFAVKAWPI